jgi:hypothetical protein
LTAGGAVATLAFQEGAGAEGGAMQSRTVGVMGMVLVVLLPAGVSPAVDLTFETTVPYVTGEILTLDAKVGEVEVSRLQVDVLQSATSLGGKLLGGLGTARGADSSTRSVLGLAFDCVNATRQEWEVTFTVELLDAEGQLIDRVSRDQDFEMESDVFEIQHEILSYVLPLIRQVTVRLDAELD